MGKQRETKGNKGKQKEKLREEEEEWTGKREEGGSTNENWQAGMKISGDTMLFLLFFFS